MTPQAGLWLRFPTGANHCDESLWRATDFQSVRPAVWHSTRVIFRAPARPCGVLTGAGRWPSVPLACARGSDSGLGFADPHDQQMGLMTHPTLGLRVAW